MAYCEESCSSYVSEVYTEVRSPVQRACEGERDGWKDREGLVGRSSCSGVTGSQDSGRGAAENYSGIQDRAQDKRKESGKGDRTYSSQPVDYTLDHNT